MRISRVAKRTFSSLRIRNFRLVRLRHIIVGAAALGVAMLILAFVPSVAVAVPAVLLVGIASILYVTSTTAIVQVEADPTMHGRVLAIQTVLLVDTAPIGGPLLGALGARAPIIIGGVACLAGAAWAAVAGRRAYAPGTRTTPAEAGVERDQEPEPVTSELR